MKFFSYLGLFLFICLSASQVKAQDIYRIKGRVSIKTISDSTSNLTIGNFYYDKTKQNIVYQITFPSPEIWVFADTTVYRFANDSLVSRDTSISLNDFSIFHMVLNHQLENYGLKNSVYHLADVELSKGLVISTWSPPAEADHILGDVVLSTKDKRLYGIVFLNAEKELMRRQMFKEYTNLLGVAFPSKIHDVFFTEGFTMEQITTYSNISVNEKDNSKFYDFTLPAEYRYLFPD
jgi:hypothetical protein